MKRVTDAIHKDLKKQALLHMSEGVAAVLDGNLEKFYSDLVSMNDVINLIEELGGEDIDDLEINGWQWDAWDHVKYKDRVYIISTSGYYGGVSFEEVDEDWDRR